MALSLVAAGSTRGDVYDLVEIPTRAQKDVGDFPTEFVGDIGHVSVIELSGNYDRDVGGVLNLDPRLAVAREFYEHHPDVFDFLVIFTSFEFDTGDAEAFFINSKNDIEGIGTPIFDNSDLWGSGGQLQGYIDMAAISRRETDPLKPRFEDTLVILGHEMMHNWCCRVDFQLPGEAARTDLIGWQDAHWSFKLDSDASLMYGQDWRNNGDGSYSIVGLLKFYSRLDLYLAGFLASEEVGDIVLLENPDVEGAALPERNGTITAAPLVLGVDDIIRAEGPRIPAAEQAQKTFRAAFIYLKRAGEPLLNEQLVAVERIREAYLTRFPILTGGRGIVEIFPEDFADAESGEPDPVVGGPTRPTSADVVDAFAWLRDQQAPEGFWQDRPGTRVRDTQVVLETLLELDPIFTGGPTALAWLAGQDETSTDLLARLALALEGGGLSAASQRVEVAGRQNADGGWGPAASYGSTPLDTALALLALEGFVAPGSPPATAAIAFLNATENPAGGWGNGVGGASRSSVTATVLRALALYDAGQGAAGIDFLASKQNGADGGFGDSPSSIHDTAWVLDTLLRLGATAAIDRNAAESYLQSRQTEDGSWAGSVYATALAARTLLATARPDLEFAAAISAEPTSPRDGERVALAFTVRNAGGIAAATTLDVFDGDPAAGGMAIASGSEVPLLNANDSTVVTVSWETADLAGEHLIYALLDPANVIDEANESDNLATLELTVSPPPAGAELEIAAADLSFAPEMPAELPTDVGVFVNVRNFGLSSAPQTRVVVWQGTPGSGTPVHDERVDVPARSNVLVNFTFELTVPSATLTVVVDPDNEIVEEDESNNITAAELVTQPTFDLEVLPEDVELLTPTFPGTDIRFRVTVRNRGTRDLPQNARVTFRISDGNTPLEIGDELIFLEAGASTDIEVVWLASLLGDLQLLVDVDGQGLLESDLSNNSVAFDFNIGTFNEPNLTISNPDISFVPDPGREGKVLQIDVQVRNTGGVAAENFATAVYDGNPDEGGALVAGPVTATVGAGESTQVSLLWNRVPDDLDRDVFVVVDPDDLIAEVSEDDNLTFKFLEVLSLPDFALSEASFSLAPAFPEPGDAVTLTVTVANTGEQEAADVVVQLFDADPAAGGQPLAPQQVIDVPGTGFAPAVFDFTVPPGSNSLRVFAVVDPDGLVEEQSTANNTAERDFAVQDGDFSVLNRYLSPNGDGILDDTRFFFRLATPGDVAVRVVDGRDRVVRTFTDEFLGLTFGDVLWDGRDDRGRIVRDGKYFLQAVSGSGDEATVLGEAAAVIDTNQSPLLRAAGTDFQNFINLTCLLPEADSFRINSDREFQQTDDEQWYYFRIFNPSGTAFRRGIHRVSAETFRASEVYTDNTEFPIEVAVAGDASYVSWATRNSNATRYNLWLAEGDGTNRLEIGLPQTSFRRFPVGFDAEARHLIFVDNRSEVFKVPVDRPLDPPTLLFDGASTIDDDEILISPDRTKLLVQPSSFSPDGMWLIDIESGTQVEILDTFLSASSFSPDGRLLATREPDAQIGIYDASGARLRTLEMPEFELPEDAQEFANQSITRGVSRAEWSTVTPQLAVTVFYSVDTDFDLFIEWQQIVVIDYETGEAESIAWTEVDSFGGGAIRRGEDDAELKDKTLEPRDEGLKEAQEPVPAWDQLRWAPNDEALLVGEFFGPGSWMVFLGEPGDGESPCPDGNGEGGDDDCFLITDADNRWEFAFTEFNDRHNYRFAPSGRTMVFESTRDNDDPDSVCFNSGASDEFHMRSFMNLTADLRIRRSVDPTNVLLEGSAVDLNFERYRLEYTLIDEPDDWKPVSPPRSRPVFDELFQTWVPPGPGTWLVRLTVEDKAGNERQTIRQVSAAEFPEITDVYVLPELFSPNFDGTLDETFIHYLALEPVIVDIEIFAANGQLVRLLVEETPAAGEVFVPWDGRGFDGLVVADGRYIVRIQGSYEFPVEVDTTPIEVSTRLRDPYRIDNPSTFPAPKLLGDFLYGVSTSRPEEVEIASEIVERGEGAFPIDWPTFPRFNADRRGGALTYGEFANGRLRVRASDQAGNLTVETTELGAEKLMLLGIGDHEIATDGVSFEPIEIFNPAEDPDRGILLGLIELQSVGVYSPGFITDNGVIRFHLGETVRAEISRLTVEHRDQSSDPWQEDVIDAFLEPGSVSFVGAPSADLFEVVWDGLGEAPEFSKQVRLVAEDPFGQRFATTIFELRRRPEVVCTEIVFRGTLTLDDTVFREENGLACVDGPELLASVLTILQQTGLDPEVQTIFWGYESVAGELSDVELLVRSAEDPNYAVWTDVPLVGQVGAAMLFLPDPEPRTCSEYIANLSGLTPPELDPATGTIAPRLVSTDGPFATPCLAIRAQPVIHLAENCGDPAPQRMAVRLVAIDETGEDRLELLTFGRLVEGGEEILFSREQPVSGLVIDHEVDLSVYDEGVETFVARLTNDEGQASVVKLELNIDHTPPVAAIDFPQQGEVVCGFRNSLEILGTISDEVPDASAGPARGVLPGFIDLIESSEGLPLWEIDNAGCPDCGGLPRDPDSGQFLLDGPLAEVSNVSGPQSHVLKVWDRGGNLTCLERSYVVDAFVAAMPTRTDFRDISPNSDGIQDEMRLDYFVAEPLDIDVEVWDGFVDPLFGCVTDGPLERTLAADQTVIEDGELFWNGLDDGGTLVPDGIHAVIVRNRDTCGNQAAKIFCVEVDTVAPALEIVFPRLEDQDLPVMVEIEYSVSGDKFHTLSFGESHDPDSWQSLSVSGNSFNPKISRWNTFGLAGDWTLRLIGVDAAGNRSEVREPLTLPVRADLITYFEPLPELFSPNGDGRRDEESLRFGLLDAADIDLRIEDLDGGLIRNLAAAERFDGGGQVVNWDGLDNGGQVATDERYRAVLTATLASDPNFIQDATVSFDLDATPPTIDISRPAADSFIRGEGNVEGTIFDVRLTEYTVSLAPASPTPLWQEIASGEVSRLNEAIAPLGELEEGEFLLQVLAEDAGESRSEAILPFTVDNTPPEVEILAPTAGAVIGAIQGPAEIRGTVADLHLDAWRLEVGAGSEPTTFTVLVDGGEEGPPEELLTAWDLAAVADGPYTLRLSAEDKAGNAAETRLPVVVDNTPPDALLTVPADGSFIVGPTPIEGTADDLHFVEYRLEIASTQNGPPTEWLEIAFSPNAVVAGQLTNWQALPPDGDYALRLVARDQPGHVSQAQIAVVVDTTPPAGPIQLVATVENQRDGRLVWTPNTEPDLAGYRVYRGGQLLTQTLVPEPTYLDPALVEGTYVYRVTAVDQAGLESEPSNDAEIEVDTTPPQANISVPLDGARVSGVVDIKGTAFSQDFAEYRLFAERLDGPGGSQLLRQSPAPVQADFLGPWNTLGLPEEAQFRLLLEAEDLSGNVATDAVVVTVDNQPPAAPIELTATVVGGNDIEVTWTASTEPDLFGYLLFRDGRIANADGPVVGDLTPFALTSTTFLDQNLPDGTYTYLVHALDEAGNLSDPSNEDDATIETQPPRAVIVDPEAGHSFETTLPIVAETEDNDVATVQFQYRPAGTTPWIDLGDADTAPAWTTTLDPVAEGLAFGDVDLRAVATDDFGNTDPAPPAITVTYADLTPPDIVLAVATLVDGGEVTVTWEPDVVEPFLAGYHVYRRGTFGSFQRLTTTPIADTTYLDVGLADALYAYAVTAVDSEDNESAFSNEAPALVFTPLLEQPFTPIQELTTTVEGSGPAEHEVFGELTNALGSTPIVPTTSDSEGLFTVDLVLERGANALTLRMQDTAGNRSKPASVTVISGEAPSQPQNLSGSVAGFQVDLTWDPNPELDLIGYRVLRNDASAITDVVVSDFDSFTASQEATGFGGPFIAENAFDGNLSTYWATNNGTDQWLAVDWPGARIVTAVELDWWSTTYVGGDFRIQGLNEVGWVTLARITSNTDLANRIELARPYRTDQVRVLVEKARFPTFFRPIRLAEMRVETMVIQPTTPTAFTDTAPDGIHTYSLTAWNELGFESPPAEPTPAFEVGDVVPPDPPVLAALVVNEWDVELTWTVVADAVRYDLYRDGAKIHEHDDLGNLLFLDERLSNGTYRYVVRAIDAVGNVSDPSNEEEVTIAVDPPAIPINLTVTAPPEGNLLEVTWQPGPGLEPFGYRLLRSLTSGGPYSLLATTSETFYFDEDVENGERYYYVVIAFDEAFNDSGQSNEASGVPERTLPAAPPTLHFPTVPERVFFTSAATTTIIGRGAADADVTLLREGNAVATTRSTDELAVEFSNFFDVYSRPYPSPDGRFVWLDNFGSPALIDFVTGDSQFLSLDSGAGRWLDERTVVFTPLFGGEEGSQIQLIDVVDDSVEVLATADSARVAVPSPSGDLYAVLAQRGGSSGVWTFDPANGVWTLVTDLGSQLFSVDVDTFSWSPDGARLAYLIFGEGGGLFTLHLDSGTVQQIDNSVTSNAVDWSPDGNQLLFTSSRDGDNQIWAYDFATGMAEVVIPFADGLWPQWAPDGASVAYIEFGDSLIEQAPGSDEGETLYFAFSYLFEMFEWSSSGHLFISDGDELLRLTPAGRFQFDDVILTSGDNIFTAEIGGAESLPIVISTSGGGDLPDYSIDLAVVPTVVLSGQLVRATATVTNEGGFTAPAAGLSMAVLGPGGFLVDLADGEVVGPLAIGDSTTVARDLVLTGDPGEYTFVAVIDPLGQVSEASEVNNLAQAEVVVLEDSGPVLTVVTDQPIYQRDETLTATIEVLGGGASFDGTLEISIEDDAGFLVHAFATRAVDALAFAEVQTELAVWPVATTFAGNYRVRARLLDDFGLLAAEGFAPFVIFGDAEVTASLASDAPSYPRGATVNLLGLFAYGAGNLPLTGSDTTLTVYDPADSAVSTWTQPLGTLLPGADGSMSRNWPSGDAAVGTYRAVFEVRRDSEELATAETSFVLTAGAVELAGTLTLPAVSPEVGEDVTIGFTIEQVAGEALSEAVVRITIADGSTLELRAEEQLIVSLTDGAANGEVTLSTVGMSLGNQLVVLEGAVTSPSPAFVTLDLENLETVDRTPPAVAIAEPASGFHNVADLPVRVNAIDALSGVATVELSIDGGPFVTLLPHATLDHLWVGDLTALPEGEHVLVARATDVAGNVGLSLEVSLIVDLTPPEILISGVEDGGVYDSERLPVIEIIELYPASETIELNGEPFVSGTPVSEPGDYVLAVVAEDQAGNRSEATVSFTIGAEQDLELTLEPLPVCSDQPTLPLVGAVVGSAEIDRVFATINGGDAVDLCVDCGDDPSFDVPVDLAACDNAIVVTAEDVLGAAVSAAAATRFDAEAPVFAGCEDVRVEVAAGDTGAFVDFAVSAGDLCDGALPVTCDQESGAFFPLGATEVSCSVADTCGNATSCAFTIEVVEPCRALFGVEDIAEGDSQFFRLDQVTGEITTLGPVYPDFDVESLARHPLTGALYAVAGSSGDEDGRFYQIDKETGGLTPLGETGAAGPREIAALSFHPEGTLWAFQKRFGFHTVDLDTGELSEAYRLPGFGDDGRAWDGIAWDVAGTVIYGVQDDILYRWDPATLVVEELCGGAGFLPLRSEALEVDLDGRLIGGWHEASDPTLRLFEIDVDSCEVRPSGLDVPFTDVEGLVFEDCNEVLPSALGRLGDRVWLDRNSDGVEDVDEPGINGVRVELYDAAGELRAETSTAAGAYQFKNLPPDLYSVRIDAGTLPAVVATFDLDGLATADEAQVELLEGEERFDVDFGYGPAPGVCPEPLLIGVHDEGSSDSQLFRLDLLTREQTPIGPLYAAHDIEALDLDPLSGALYAVAGSSGDQDGNFYRVDLETGALELLGNTGATGAREVAALSFHPGGALWAFQKRRGFYTVDLTTGALTEFHRLPGTGDDPGRSWEGMAWDPAGALLYGSQGSVLYRFDPETRAIEELCGGAGFLPDRTESLDFDLGGQLVGSWEDADAGALSLFIIDVVACEVRQTLYAVTPLNDVESLAFASCEAETP